MIILINEFFVIGFHNLCLTFTVNCFPASFNNEEDGRLLFITTYSEETTRGVLRKKVFLEILQNSLENTCARVSFLIKLQAYRKSGTQDPKVGSGTQDP